MNVLINSTSKIALSWGNCDFTPEPGEEVIATSQILSSNKVWEYNPTTQEFDEVCDADLENDLSRSCCGMIDGLKLSYIDTHRIKIGIGCARSDCNKEFMPVESELTIDLELSGPGGLDTGSEEINTKYFVWLIAKDSSSNGDVDGLFSKSSTSPTLPDGWKYKRRIGYIFNKWGGDIANFIQFGNGKQREYYWAEQRNTWCRILDSGIADHWTEINCNGRVSPTAEMGYFLITNKDGGGASSMRMRFKGNAGTSGMCFVRKGWYASATQAQGNGQWLPVVDEVIEYQMDNDQNAGHIEVLGFTEVL